MRTCFFILSFAISLAAFGQDSLGFTNKAEAKIDTDDLNKPEGKWIKYIENNGEFAGADTTAPFYYLTVYRNGKPYGTEREFYKSGKLKCVRYYSNGGLNGMEKGYYESGALYYEDNWTNDKQNGIQKIYYKDGRLKSEIPYKNGKANGIWKKYDENGKLLSAIPYKDGKEDGTIKIDESGNEIKQ